MTAAERLAAAIKAAAVGATERAYSDAADDAADAWGKAAAYGMVAANEAPSPKQEAP